MSARKTILTKLKLRYLRIRVTECALLAISISLLVYGAFSVLDAAFVSRTIFSILAGVLTFIVRFFQLGLHRITEKSVAMFLNFHYPEVTSSADLVMMPEESLSPLAKIQRVKTFKNLESLSVQFPNRVIPFLIFVVVGIGSLAVIRLTGFKIKNPSVVTAALQQAPRHVAVITNLPAELKEVRVNIAPPAYTAVKNYDATDLNLSMPENSGVTWTIEFSQPVKKAGIVISSQDTSWFIAEKDQWKFSTTLDRNGFYQLHWQDEEAHTSAYYKIEIQKDQPPEIELTSLEQFTQVVYHSKKQLPANPTITDDYGLTDAYLIATVSKGSGESVKFREERIRFTERVTGKRITPEQILDLNKLGMEPGDELYFYVEALDNRTPQRNRTRTETYFISIPDTAQDVMVADGGLGVDLMPEYFRSQRQIIIDTEKLIRDRKTITKQKFNSRSNALAYDQKVLRLRYGQFMGEEEDSGIATTADHADEDHTETGKPEDIIKQFGHQHDTENEHNLVEEKNPVKRDVDGTKKADPFAEFKHEHDNEESATFFFQSLKVKLKAALTQMWDAELYLRLNEPEKSLPYQYVALALLKEISNDSRIYVHRTGFEPPPIKEEKRLSADLNELSNSSATHLYENTIRFPAISQALSVVEKLLATESEIISEKDKNLLRQSGNELAQAALENPALLEGLSALRILTDDRGKADRNNVIRLRKAYWLALPVKPVPAAKNKSMLHELDNALIKQLDVRQP